ncbi:MAG: adenosylcobinamide-GDP ribazoletransferase [Candidatus Latescibacteria bacterium]|nr:adenosylcobinamide-GDP ribazoletransferase [Candidatus Latescibacterota bacterium]
MERGGAGVEPVYPVFFPVGLLIGAVAAAWAWGLGRILPAWPVSVLTGIALVGASRGLHLDGLSDTADGFLSSRPRERILEIMRDSHVGAMGVVAIVCAVCLKVATLASLPDAVRWRAVLLMPVAGRCALVVSLAALPYARAAGGLGALFYRGRSRLDAVWAVLFSGLAGWVVAGLAGLVVFAISVVFTLLFAVYTYRKIGGATGDTLGAACELAEIVPALALCAWPE